MAGTVAGPSSLQTGEAHIIRNAGGVVTDDLIRCLIISHHLPDTNEIILIHHTRCGMLACTDDLIKAGLKLTWRPRSSSGRRPCAYNQSQEMCVDSSQFHAFRGPLETLDAAPSAKQNMSRLAYGKDAQADCPKRDRYGRQVCKVYVGGQDVGLRQIYDGLAWWYRAYAHEQSPEDRQRGEFEEREARLRRWGLWADPSPVPPWEWRAQKRQKR